MSFAISKELLGESAMRRSLRNHSGILTPSPSCQIAFEEQDRTESANGESRVCCTKPKRTKTIVGAKKASFYSHSPFACLKDLASLFL